ncbi:MAG: hypothetical protein U5R14_05920 [Gemmatimonadota bacterium]|nr:hypothetical protein [Gemmatimonadota bacterium]
MSEDSTTGSFTVVLDAEPDSSVVFDVASGDTGEATVDSTTLTFEPAEWDQEKTVVVTGEDDDLIDGAQTTPVTVSVADGSDAAFVDLADDTVEVTTEDNDSARVRGGSGGADGERG